MRETEPVHFQLYIRIGCHLCDDMLLALQQFSVQNSAAFELQQIDIDEDESLKALYDTRVPVLMMGDEMLCEYFFDPVSVEAALNRAAEHNQAINEEHT